jgi:hypothetical protein
MHNKELAKKYLKGYQYLVYTGQLNILLGKIYARLKKYDFTPILDDKCKEVGRNYFEESDDEDYLNKQVADVKDFLTEDTGQIDKKYPEFKQHLTNRALIFLYRKAQNALIGDSVENFLFTMGISVWHGIEKQTIK